MFQSCSLLSKGRFESRKYSRMAAHDRTNNVWDISVFPYFGGYSVCKRVRRWDGDWKSRGRRKGERSYLGSIGGADCLALFRSTRERDNMVRHSPRTILSTVPASVASGFPRRRSGGDAVAFVCRRRWAPRSGFSAQALKSEIRVALRRRHADASHHALPSTGHSPSSSIKSSRSEPLSSRGSRATARSPSRCVEIPAKHTGMASSGVACGTRPRTDPRAASRGASLPCESLCRRRTQPNTPERMRGA